MLVYHPPLTSLLSDLSRLRHKQIDMYNIQVFHKLTYYNNTYVMYDDPYVNFYHIILCAINYQIYQYFKISVSILINIILHIYVLMSIFYLQ